MSGRLKILVLEDSSDDFFLLKEAIDSSVEIEAELLRVSRLSEAISKVENMAVDAAILDLQVPDSTGLDTFIGFHKQCPDTPTIILSGTKDNDTALEAVRRGAQDYLNKGEPSSSAIVRTIRYAIERQRLTEELKRTSEEIKILRGILPICCECKKIRDDKGNWISVESYIHRHSEAKFSHGICRDCAQKLYPDLKVRKE